MLNLGTRVTALIVNLGKATIDDVGNADFQGRISAYGADVHGDLTVNGHSVRDVQSVSAQELETDRIHNTGSAIEVDDDMLLHDASVASDTSFNVDYGRANTGTHQFIVTHNGAPAFSVGDTSVTVHNERDVHINGRLLIDGHVVSSIPQEGPLRVDVDGNIAAEGHIRNDEHGPLGRVRSDGSRLHEVATHDEDGFMPASDKAKVDHLGPDGIATTHAKLGVTLDAEQSDFSQGSMTPVAFTADAAGDRDPAQRFDASEHTFTVPVSGDYMVMVHVNVNNAGARGTLAVKKNGVIVHDQGVQTEKTFASDYDIVTLFGLHWFDAGDVLHVVYAGDSTDTIQTDGTRWSLHLMSGIS